jgi:hypothetical protein
LSVDAGTITKGWINGVLDRDTGATSGWRFNGAYTLGMGRTAAGGNYFNGYLAEWHFVDGQALTAADFGEFDTVTGAWVPKRYGGTYGSNGYYLKFDPSATNGIGHDHSGNGNHWTASGFSTSGTGTDVMSDTPTTNWCTLNPLIKPATSSNVPTNGNLEITSAGGGYDQIRVGTIMISSGKWYWEYRMEGTYNYGAAGLIDPTIANFYSMMASSTPNPDYTGGFKRQQNGNTYSAGVTTVATPSISNGDVAMFAVDYNTGKVWVGTAGTWYNSGDPAAGTNPTLTIQTLTNVVPFFSPTDSGSQQYIVNFGQRAFAYTPPTGYKALNTANLPEPTIKDGGKYFNTVLWTGNGTSQSITGVGFQPDFLWSKARSQAYSHRLHDVVRGREQSLLSNSTGAEFTQANSITSFDTGGFTLGSDGSHNESGTTYVGWNWKAGGTGVSNNSGTITSTVSANASAGFSIVTWTGTGADGSYGHGLGVKPAMIIHKRRDSTSDWHVWHQGLPTKSPTNDVIYLNLTNAQNGGNSNLFRLDPTSSVIYTGSAGSHNVNGATYVDYVWSEVAGYSKFGSYTGNGSSDGPFVFCGFRPAWVLIKSSSASGESWILEDSTRDTYNPAARWLYPNYADAESNGLTIDFLSNGFKPRISGTSVNTSSATYIFAAFAELPFKYANAR